MMPQWIIENKRDGKALTEEEIRFFIDGFSRNEIPDYQMAALAMAVYLQGMTFEETAVLTDAMMRSGNVLDTSGLDRPVVDKHSTGGIGDKVSLILGPLAAACGLAVPMISGRGLGITGGTLDKMESIPGYRTDLNEEEFLGVVAECGCSIIGQTANLAPADKKLYALRDVTGTVPSIPLITASIMCKKMAEGLDGLVLDVKWGAGAFMETRESARKLAENMVQVGRAMHKKVTAVITDMNEPLGCAAGNALEVIESIEALQGRGPADLMSVTFALGEQMLLLGGLAGSAEDARSLLEEKLNAGEAWTCFKRMVDRQGGSVETVEQPERLPHADRIEEIKAHAEGFVSSVDAREIGRGCLVLGAGRRQVMDAVRPGVGVDRLIKTGAPVAEGDVLMRVHADDRKSLHDALHHLTKAVRISSEEPPPCDKVGEIIWDTHE